LCILLSQVNNTIYSFTNLDHGDLQWIEDCWTADAREGTHRELDEEFLGRTVHTLLKKKPMPGYEYQNGRLTKVHEGSSRPEHIFSNNWARVGVKQKEAAKAYWAVQGPIRDRERRMSGREANIRLEDYEQYDRVVNDTRQSLLVKPSPAMPCSSLAMSGLGEERSSQVFDTSIYMNTSVNSSSGEPRGAHQENEKPAGFGSEHYFVLIHKSIPVQEAKRIPAAEDAIDSEFRKLDKRGFVDWNRVQEKSDVMVYAVDHGIEYHFGDLMTLCHEKHAELNLPQPKKVYKCRIVFRGDIVEDEIGYLVIFSEQGTSSSQLEAAKMMDALAPASVDDEEECDGEEGDAIGAYTQAKLGSPPTWITIPKEYWPASWHKMGYVKPVVPLLSKLYGHPLAGLYWERHCQGGLFSMGFEKVKGWECLYVHRQERLYLSVYVEDFKMAGRKVSLKPMWEKIKIVLDIVPPVPLSGSTYLGCRQDDIAISSSIKESMDMQKVLHAVCCTKGNQPSQGGCHR
jgi:hypothetical protein